MKKIVEALKSLLPEDQLKEVSVAFDEMFKEAVEEVTKQKEAEMNKKLEDAYNELSSELATAEKTAEQGYEEAFAIITDLRNRIELQKEEFEKTLDSGYGEAWEMIEAEKAKNGTLELDLHEEYETKYNELKEYFVDMIDKFLQNKGAEIYEQAKRDVLNDPRYAEHKVALDRIIDIAANYLNEEEFAFATSSKLEESYKQLEELKGAIKVMEARNIRLARENEKLTESVTATKKEVVTEATKVEKKERVEKAKSVSGRGQVITEQETKVIAEHNQDTATGKDTKQPSTLLESLGYTPDVVNTLAGTKKAK